MTLRWRRKNGRHGRRWHWIVAEGSHWIQGEGNQAVARSKARQKVGKELRTGGGRQRSERCVGGRAGSRNRCVWSQEIFPRAAREKAEAADVVGGGGLADAAQVLVLLLKPVRVAGGAVGAAALSRGNCRLKD